MVAVSLAFYILDEIIEVIYATITTVVTEHASRGLSSIAELLV